MNTEQTSKNIFMYINVNSEIVIAKYKKSAIVKFSSPKFVKDFQKWRTISLAEATTAGAL